MGECCTVASVSNVEACIKSGPICDSDNRAHQNLCTFQHKQCLLNRTEQKLINIAYYGELINSSEEKNKFTITL